MEQMRNEIQMSDSCIHDDSGQIMLFALVGCSNSSTDADDKMFGLWEMNNGKREIVCWKYENVILVYAKDNKVMTFQPSEQSSECPVPSTHISPFQEKKLPIRKYLESVVG